MIQLFFCYHRQKDKVGFFDKKLDLKAGFSGDKCCFKTSLDKLNTYSNLMRLSFHFLEIVVVRIFFNFWAKIRKAYKSYPYRMCVMAKASNYYF